MPVAIIYISVSMLFLGVLTLPYGYYTLLRIVVFGVFFFAAFVSFDRKNKTLPWVYGLLALIFNPIIKIHLPKEFWIFIDIGAGALLLITAKSIQSKLSKP